MGNKLLIFSVLFIFLGAGFSGISGLEAGANSFLAPGLQQVTQALPTWQQVNSNGFGDQQVEEVGALAAFNGDLYAGTFNPINPPPGPVYDGAQIFRSSNGTTWNAVTLPGFGQLHDIRSPAILDMLVFNGRLYASTGRGDGPGQIWRTVNGTTWAPMTITGFSDPDTVDFTALAEYGGWIYAGATNLVSGAQIWRSSTGDGNIGSWTKVGPGVPGPAGFRITGFAEFDGALYAAVESAGPAQVWRSNSGTNWTAVVSNGFGNSLTKSTGGLAVFGGHLYAGVGNETSGAQLWRSNNGTSWTQAITPGFGDTNNLKVESVFVFENMLYASVKNGTTGIEIWRSNNGTSWEQVNQDGFGDSQNTATNWSNATTGFLGQLYVGTVNVTNGGELWRMETQTQPTLHPVFIPISLRSPDASCGEVIH